MAFIPTPNVARCAIQYSLFGQQLVNTLWFRKVGLGPIEPIDLADLGNDLGTWCDTNVLPLLSNDIDLISVTATSQDSLIAPSVVTPFPGSGGAAGGSLPGNVCFTVKFNTAFRGRSGRGRNYIGGIRESDVTGNTVSLLLTGAMVTSYNALVSTPPSGWNFVVVSHYSENEPRTEGLVMDILSTSVVDAFVDSQRRRLTGRGS